MESGSGDGTRCGTSRPRLTFVAEASPPRFGMADHALNSGKLTAQPALKGIHNVVHRTDRQRRIDLAVKIDDFSGGGFPHPHVMNLAERWEFRRERG